MECKRVLQDCRHVTQGSDMLRGVRACCEGCEHVAHGAGMLRAVRARRVRCGRVAWCGHAAHGIQECRGRCRYVTYGPRHLMRNADTLCMAQARYVRCRASHGNRMRSTKPWRREACPHLEQCTCSLLECCTRQPNVNGLPMAKQRSSSPVGRNASAGGSRHKVSAFASDRKARPTSSSRKSAPRHRRSQSAARLRLPPGAPTVSGRKASSAISDRKASPAAIDRKGPPRCQRPQGPPCCQQQEGQPSPQGLICRKRPQGALPYHARLRGCEWLGLPYRKQLKRKHAAMVELYEPLIGRFGWNVHVDDALGMGPSREAGTRHRGRLAACLTARFGTRPQRHSPPAPMAKCAAAFCPRHPTIVPCPACPVEAPGARELLNEVARLASDLGIPAYDEDRRQGQLRYAVLRCGWRTNESMLTLVTRTREVPHLDALAQAIALEHPGIVTIAQNVNPRVTNAILGGETRLLHGGAPHARPAARLHVRDIPRIVLPGKSSTNRGALPKRHRWDAVARG